MSVPNLNPSSQFLSDFSPMDCTVEGGDPPTGSLDLPLPPPPPSLPLLESLSVSSMSPPTPPQEPLNGAMRGTSISVEAPPPIEPLNDAVRGTSISVEPPPQKKKCPERYAEFVAERERRKLADLENRKRFIEMVRTGTFDPTCYHGPCKRVRVLRTKEEPDRLHPLFQCDRGHCLCIECYEHHSKKCRYCLTTKGSVVNLTKEKAAESTNQYSCHKGRGWVIPKEDDFFCPDSCCQFCGPLDNVLVHITDVHSMIIQNFSYGEVIRIPLHLVGKYVVLRAEDGTAFVLWVDHRKYGKFMSVFCAEQPSFCRTRFTLELTYNLRPVVRSWLRGQHWTPLHYASNPRMKPWEVVGSSIVKYDKTQDVYGIANADSCIISWPILSSNLGNMHVDDKNCALCVPWTFHGSYCGPKMWDILSANSDISRAALHTVAQIYTSCSQCIKICARNITDLKCVECHLSFTQFYQYTHIFCGNCAINGDHC